MTPLSWNSSQRSLPSRVRSPTPANTDTPPCFMRDVVDQLLDDDRLADAGAAEQADLAALQVRLEQVDDLDAGLEHLQLGRLLLERRRGAVDRPALLRLHRPVREVDRLAEHVQHAAERLGPDRHRDRLAGVDRPSMPRCMPSVGFIADRADAVLAEVLLDLGDDVDAARGAVLRLEPDAQRVVDRGQVSAANSTSTTGPMTWTTLPIAVSLQFCAICLIGVGRYVYGLA